MNRQFEVAIVLEKLSRHHKFQAAVRLCMLKFRRYKCDVTQGRKNVYQEELCNSKSINSGGHMDNISLGSSGKPLRAFPGALRNSSNSLLITLAQLFK